MYMENKYYLNLEFKNAKFYYKEKEESIKDNPIDTWTIANVINVIFCQRPVNRNRQVSYNISDYYMDKAENSLMEIDYNKKRNIFPNNKYNNFSDNIIHDNTNLTKSVKNSNVNNMPNASWYYFKNVLENHEYEYLINNILKNLLNYNPEEKSFHEVRMDCKNLKLTTEDVENLCEKHKKELNSLMLFRIFFENEKKGTDPVIYNYESTKKNNNYLGMFKIKYKRKDRPYGYSVLKSEPRPCIQLKGNIYVPINDDDITFLKKYSTGHATILDGGLVRIKEIIPQNFISKTDKIKFKKHEITN